MIINDLGKFYWVYPSWAKLVWDWKDLDAIFRDPYGTGALKNEGKFERIGYVVGADKYELIPGPVGNGIIKGVGNLLKDKYLWVAVLIYGKNYDGVDFSEIPGITYELKLDARWLEEKNTAEHKVGLKKRYPTYLPRISLDYAECKDSEIYVSLAFRATRSRLIDEEACLRFQMRCVVFGWKCTPMNEELLHTLPDTARKLYSTSYTQRWFLVEKKDEDMGLLTAKMFYLACAAKQEANKLFDAMLLVGNFEGKPAVAQSWRRRDGSYIFEK